MELFLMSCLRNKQIDMQYDYYFQLHHQLKNFKFFVTKGIFTMCFSIGSPTSSLPLI